MLIKYIRECEMEKTFSFRYIGSKVKAEQFVHRMRVELSRLRNKVKATGRVPRPFKTIIVSITPDPKKEGSHIVVLKKTMHRYDPSSQIDEVFEDLAGGSLLNG